MKATYRDITEKDRAFFVALHHTVLRGPVEAMYGWDEPLQDQFANDTFDHGELQIICHEGTDIGVIAYEELPDHIMIKEILISPDYQGKGLGSAIISSIIDEAARSNKTARLQVLKTNPRAMTLYKRLGFTMYEETKTHDKLEISVGS